MRYKAIFIMIIVFLAIAAVNVNTVAIAEDVINFDETNVLDDLMSSEQFNIDDYPYNPNKQLQIIHFIEYCYDSESSDYYGLYLYLYNPADIDFILDSNLNKVQIAIFYDDDDKPIDYAKHSLQYCNKSEDSYDNLFIKYKVLNIDSIYNRVNSSCRRYDISGVELQPRNFDNAVDYKIGCTYEYIGYAAGFGSNESTLNCVVNELETISLNLYHTNYRTGVSSAGVGHQNELHTVYFSVPDRFVEDYGKLQRIKAEFWEYKTSPIIITTNINLKNILTPYLGIDIGCYDEDIPFNLNIGEYIYSVQNNTYINYDWTYNIETGSFGIIDKVHITSDDVCNKISYLFYDNGIDIEDYEVNADEIKAYILNYNRTSSGSLEIKDGVIAANLFADDVDKGRIKGYNCIDVDSDNLFNMLTYDDTYDWFEKFVDFGFNAPETGGEYEDISPIEAVNFGIFDGLSNNQLADRYYINYDDVAAFKMYCYSEQLQGNTVFLFRYAVTDYFSDEVEVNIYPDTYHDAYMVQETIFFDFDIIQLTFNRDGVYKVIPVVSNPIDVINDITPPLQDKDFNWFNFLKGEGLLKKVLMFIGLILLILILIPFLPVILNVLVFVITLPFKLIRKAVRGIKDVNRDRKIRALQKYNKKGY